MTFDTFTDIFRREYRVKNDVTYVFKSQFVCEGRVINGMYERNSPGVLENDVRVLIV